MMISVGDFDRFVFVVGAPRCGTTTIAQFLRAHPSVNFPAVKEPHFFAQHDLRGLSDPEQKKQVERDYLARFFTRHEERRVGADASVTYLYMAEQLEPALRLWPDSRFIIALRDPLSMLPSLYRRLRYLGDETIGNFADAWAATEDRSAGRRIPRRCADPRFLRYDEAGRFATHLEKLFSVVGRERCQVVIFDDLQADPEAEYGRIMEFAGLKPVEGMDFTPRRSGKSVRYHWLQRLLKRPPAAVRDLLAGEQTRVRDGEGAQPEAPKATKAVLSLRKRLLRWNRVPAVPEHLSPALEAQIRERLSGEVERLEILLDRDLSHWLGRDQLHQSGEQRAIAAE
jgi:hypothetical protein